jgi:predicted RNase H-like nuclease
MLTRTLKQIAGVDGCKGGFAVVYASAEAFDKAEIKVFETFPELISTLAPESIIAIDIPIGLPDQAIAGGREPDWAARAFLGKQRASVFPVPSRQAVYADKDVYERVCVIAQATSDPPRKPSKQVFGIFPRIQEVDKTLRQDLGLRERVFEAHPEVSFRMMNNNEPLTERKKVKGRLHLPGMELRRELLAKEGFPPSFLDQKPPSGAAFDDFYDACACAWSARRILHGKARVFPAHPPQDGEGLEQAIRG